MDNYELKKLIFSNKDGDLIKYLQANLDAKNHSKSVQNLKIIDKMDFEDKRFLVARLEKIYENYSSGLLISTFLTAIITLIIVFINGLISEKGSVIGIIIMIIFVLILIFIIVVLLSSELSVKSKAKYYLSLIKKEYKE